MIRELTQDAELIDQLYKTTSASPVYSGILTRELLMKLPTGAYIASSSGAPTLGPVFQQQVPPVENRDLFWHQIQLSGVGGKNISLFNNKAAFQAHITAYRKRASSRK